MEQAQAKQTQALTRKNQITIILFQEEKQVLV